MKSMSTGSKKWHRSRNSAIQYYCNKFNSDIWVNPHKRNGRVVIVHLPGLAKRCESQHAVQNVRRYCKIDEGEVTDLNYRAYSVAGYHFGLLSRQHGFESCYARHDFLFFANAFCKHKAAEQCASKDAHLNQTFKHISGLIEDQFLLANQSICQSMPIDD